jgi:hypothetical protein
MQTDESDDHEQNAAASIRVSLEPDSNVKIESRSQLRKQWSPSISTDDGMQIGESDEQNENAAVLIRVSFEPASNVRLESR